jgi:hypothetical protein
MFLAFGTATILVMAAGWRFGATTDSPRVCPACIREEVPALILP